MNTRTVFGLAAVLSAVALLGPPRAAAQAAPPSLASVTALAERHAAFLTAVKPRMTLSQIKKAFSGRIHIGKRGAFIQGIHGAGHLFDFRGWVNGHFSFCDPRRSDTNMDVYRATDPVNWVRVDVPKSVFRSRALGRQYIRVISKRVGQPKDVTWAGNRWDADWKLRDGRRLWLWDSYEMLELSFPYTVPGGE